MKLPFVNRKNELAELDAAAASGGLLVVYGRRRIGKTRLLYHWMKRHQGMYSQAIEAASPMQIDQVYRDVQEYLSTSITPTSWADFFELLRLQEKPWSLCLDEFPYLVAGDASLPSMLQRWIDHEMPENCLLILSGSSTRMMHDLFLNRNAPLYARARKLLPVLPMNYEAFCGACHLRSADMEAFTRYSLVGGIPKYWEFVDAKKSALQLAEELFFGFAPYLEQEPLRLLRDENMTGMNMLSLLEAIGRGVTKPSEMAARLATAQTNLGRPLQQLLDSALVKREIPFGESLRSTKRTSYRIADPTLQFWFGVYSPHRSRWHLYSMAQKKQLLHHHASHVFEESCRALHPYCSRYWEGNLEFDAVREEENKRIVVSEIKWKKLTAKEKTAVLAHLKNSWQQSRLALRYKEVDFEVLDSTYLPELAREEVS